MDLAETLGAQPSAVALSQSPVHVGFRRGGGGQKLEAISAHVQERGKKKKGEKGYVASRAGMS